MEPMILGVPVGAFVVLSVVAPTWLVYLGFESPYPAFAQQAGILGHGHFPHGVRLAGKG